MDSLIDEGDDVARFIGAVERICSFDAETPVATAESAIPISEIDVGDRVLAWNEATHATGYYTVTATLAHADSVIVHLTVDGEIIETTPEHPFYAAAAAPRPYTRMAAANNGPSAPMARSPPTPTLPAG